VLEKRERVSTVEVEEFSVLDKALAGINKENVLVIMNKCDPEDDKAEDVLEYYHEAVE
jgi:hypothetical protein